MLYGMFGSISNQTTSKNLEKNCEGGSFQSTFTLPNLVIDEFVKFPIKTCFTSDVIHIY